MLGFGRRAHFDDGAQEARPGGARPGTPEYAQEAHEKLSYNKIGNMEYEVYGHTFPNPDDPAGPNREIFTQRAAKGLDRLSGRPLSESRLSF